MWPRASTSLKGTDWTLYDECWCGAPATSGCLDQRRPPTATEDFGQKWCRTPHRGRPKLDPDNTVFCPHCTQAKVPLSSVTTRSVIHYRPGTVGRCRGSDRTREELS